MSRSRKKTAIFKDKNNKWYKRYSNKKIRRARDIPSGGAFRRVVNTYNICDYKCLCMGNGRWIPTPEDMEKSTRK